VEPLFSDYSQGERTYSLTDWEELGMDLHSLKNGKDENMFEFSG
jgi:hypothetical protein